MHYDERSLGEGQYFERKAQRTDQKAENPPPLAEQAAEQREAKGLFAWRRSGVERLHGDAEIEERRRPERGDQPDEKHVRGAIGIGYPLVEPPLQTGSTRRP